MPLPDKPKRKEESEFQHKIRQWTEEVKQRPERFPGGKEQAVAIAAEQAGVSKKMNEIEFVKDEDYNKVEKSKTRAALDILNGVPNYLAGKTSNQQALSILRKAKEDAEHKAKMLGVAEMIEDEYEDEAKSAFDVGYSVGSGMDTPGGSAGPAMRTAGRKLTGKSVGECADCAKGTCPHSHVEKALHSRALSIPFYLRGNNQEYDSDAIRRSATQQTSRMYTSLAEPVRETLQQLIDDPVLRDAERQLKRSQEIKELRTTMANIEPRGDVRFLK